MNEQILKQVQLELNIQIKFKTKYIELYSENVFNQLYNEYKNIGLSFNIEKTAVVAFNFKDTNGPIFFIFS